MTLPPHLEQAVSEVPAIIRDYVRNRLLADPSKHYAPPVHRPPGASPNPRPVKPSQPACQYLSDVVASLPDPYNSNPTLTDIHLCNWKHADAPELCRRGPSDVDDGGVLSCLNCKLSLELRVATKNA